MFPPGSDVLQVFVKIARILIIFGFAELLPGFTLTQTSDPLVGSWNFKVTISGGCKTGCKYIGMITFNQGGTAVEERGRQLNSTAWEMSSALR
jgi:hypothetical protein